MSSSVRANTPTLIERARELEDAVARDQPVRRLEAVDAAERRRPDDRAVGLRAERQRHHAGGDRRRRARRRAAGRVRRGRAGCASCPAHRWRTRWSRSCPGSPRRPRAACATTAASRSGRAPGVQHRAVLGRHVGGVDDVLDAHGHAVQRPDRPALARGRGRARAPAPARAPRRGTARPAPSARPRGCAPGRPATSCSALSAPSRDRRAPRRWPTASSSREASIASALAVERVRQPQSRCPGRRRRSASSPARRRRTACSR